MDLKVPALMEEHLATIRAALDGPGRQPRLLRSPKLWRTKAWYSQRWLSVARPGWDEASKEKGPAKRRPLVETQLKAPPLSKYP